jgi:hypothetical protein
MGPSTLVTSSVHRPHVGGLISEPDFFPTRCNCRPASVHMVQVRDDRGSMGSTNDGEVEDKYEQPPDFCRSLSSAVVSSILTACEVGIVHRDCHCICPGHIVRLR